MLLPDGRARESFVQAIDGQEVPLTLFCDTRLVENIYK
jgi:hypothetical protein